MEKKSLGFWVGDQKRPSTAFSLYLALEMWGGVTCNSSVDDKAGGGDDVSFANVPYVSELYVSAVFYRYGTWGTRQGVHVCPEHG